ncbi:MAG: CRISPR-associated CARF protein Csa3 [Candidatus Caldarchaeum sp.]
MLIAFTFGFDEKFAVRSLVRHRTGKDDQVVVFLPGSQADERTEKALTALDSFATNYLNMPEIVRHWVDVENFYDAVSELAAFFRNTSHRPVIVNLSGGMRLLVVETLVAAILSKMPITVELETEDGSVYSEFDTTITQQPNLDEVDKAVLTMLSRGPASLKILAEYAEVSTTTIWRHVKRMEKDGAIKVEEIKKGVIKAAPTSRAKLYLTLLNTLTK